MDFFRGVPFPEYKSDIEDMENAYHDGTWSFRFIVKEIMNMRWEINFMMVGNPWLVMAVCMVIYNLVVNIYFARGWAHGNFWLMANTVYLVSQAVMSVPLVYEIPLYLRHFAIFRITSLLSANIYNLVWFTGIAAWLAEIWYLP